MKKSILSLLFLAAVAITQPSCVNIEKNNPFDGAVCNVEIAVRFPSEYSVSSLAGLPVKIEEIINQYTYEGVTDASGKVSVSLPKGLYRFCVSYVNGADVFNGTSERVQILSDGQKESVSLVYSTLGPIIFKEIYCGGCRSYSPSGEFLGTYQSDKYIILHNNSATVQYLDGLCLGFAAPYNSTASNAWPNVRTADGRRYIDVYAPVIAALWQFPGDGATFPLQPGEDAVVALNGAIDHTVQYPLSVNLNKEDYFVTYDITAFDNERYHPAPGDLIQDSRILRMVIKLGQSNAYPVSINSPAFVIFRPVDCTIQEYLAKPRTDSGDEPTMAAVGSVVDKVLNVPWTWVTDAVEVFSGQSSNNSKRINVAADAGYVTLTDTYLANTLMRRKDENASAAAGYEVLQDTNNSSADFYERNPQSLHE